MVSVSLFDGYDFIPYRTFETLEDAEILIENATSYGYQVKFNYFTP